METAEPIVVEAAPVFSLNLERLGAMLMRLPAESANLGHASLKATLWYGATDDSPEVEFFRDVFQLPTSELVEKWYGGQANASRFVNGLVGREIAAHRKARR